MLFCYDLAKTCTYTHADARTNFTYRLSGDVIRLLNAIMRWLNHTNTHKQINTHTQTHRQAQHAHAHITYTLSE